MPPIPFVQAKRSLRRAASRELSRALAKARGPAPRYEPARDLSCGEHHRRLPCRRCPATPASS